MRSLNRQVTIQLRNVIGTKKIRTRLATLLLFAIIVPLLTGCWDRLEIEERALILGLGIDMADSKSDTSKGGVSHLEGSFPIPNTPLIRVTAQIAIPGRIPLGPGDGGGGSGKGEKPIWVLTSDGRTIDDALNNIQQELADRMFYGHLRVIVISKKYAQAGMNDINDYLRRTPDVRRTTWMVVCEDKAEDLMNMAPQLERVPSLYLLATLDQAVRMGKLPNAFAGTYWTADSAIGMDPFLPYVQLVQNRNMKISGLAMFKGPKMVGQTETLEIGAYMAMKGINPGGYSVLTKVPGTDTVVSYQITHRKAKTTLSIRNGRPEFTVKVSSEGNLKEKTTETATLDVKTLNEIEQEITSAGEKAMLNLIKKTQAKGSDIFGFGEYVRAKEPKYWRDRVGTIEKWEEIYKNEATFKVKANYNIRRIGGKAT